MSIRDEWNRAALAATRAAERHGVSVFLNPDKMRIRITDGTSGLRASLLAQIHDVVKREVDSTQAKVEIVGDSIVLSEADGGGAMPALDRTSTAHRALGNAMRTSSLAIDALMRAERAVAEAQAQESECWEVLNQTRKNKETP